jgi:hypothetical protein
MSIRARQFSLDTWTAVLGLILAVLVRAGVLKSVPW